MKKNEKFEILPVFVPCTDGRDRVLQLAFELVDFSGLASKCVGNSVNAQKAVPGSMIFILFGSPCSSAFN